LTTPDHTNRAREVLGPNRLLAVEQGIALGAPEQAQSAARADLARFLVWPNYRRHLLRLGFSEEDFLDQGSDRLISALYAIGDEDAAGRRVIEHLDAGADHVCVKVVVSDPQEEMTAYRRVAPVLINRIERS
jgi:probable F420-dependent oxidoreductase